MFKQCFSDANIQHTPTLSHFGEFVRVLGEAEKFFDKPVFTFKGKDISLSDFSGEKTINEVQYLYGFYKEFAIFFDEQGRVAYHFNRSQKQMLVLGRGAIVNRYKNALKREQEAIGKNHTFGNNEAWRMYWEFAQYIVT